MFKKLFVALTFVVITFGLSAVVLVPSLRARAESIPLRLETWWHEQQPHDQFVPPPIDIPSPKPEVPSAIVQLPTPNSQTPTPTLELPNIPTDQATTRPTTQLPTTRPPDQPTIQSNDQPTVRLTPAPAEVRLTNFKHDYQGWNNCGPTTVAMLLSHFGLSETQKEIAPILKPNPNDKNVGPEELAAYVRTKGLSALVRVNGDIALLKQLLANGFPVVVETWFTPKPNDGMGHYRLLVGYSDAQQKFFALDSYNGPNVALSYAEFETDWKVFNRLYLVAYKPEQSGLFDTIIGEARDDEAMWRRAEQHANAELNADANDAFAWFNMGSAWSALGKHASAVITFDRARKAGLPWRMLWYQFAIFDTYLAVGRTQDVLDLTAVNLRQASDLEESHYYRGRTLEMLGKNDEAIKEYREALRLNKNYAAAAKALER